MSSYRNVINRFHTKKILVIGDVILDKYIQGSVSRISPEAPVPIVVEKETFFNPGGSASVAHNISSLGGKVTVVGRIGRDVEGRILKKELKKNKINIEAIFADRTYPTILKTRIIAQHQQMVRIDREDSSNQGSEAVNENIIKFIEKNISRFDAVIISDYGKGMITAELIHKVCQLCHTRKKIVTVDPKVEHFSYYRGVTCITPNLKEAENAIRNIKITSKTPSLDVDSDKLKDEASIEKAGWELLRYLQLDSLLITMGEQGMKLFETGKKVVSIHTKAKEVFDVTGAGDAVISVFTLALTAGATKAQAADMANFAAGIVVGKTGAVPVEKDELVSVLKENELY